MKVQFSICFSLLFLLAQPAYSKDQERIDKLKLEIQNRYLTEYIETFENYSYMRSQTDINNASINAANSVIKSLNALIKKYPTVNQMYFLTTELIESGYYENYPLLLYNLHHSLETVRNYGYGSATFKPWQLKRLDMFCNLKAPGGGYCKQDKDNLFYTTVQHPTKKYSFGFFESVGNGHINEAALASVKCLGMDCN